MNKVTVGTITASVLAISTLGGVTLLAAPPVKKSAAKMPTKSTALTDKAAKTGTSAVAVIGDNTPLTEEQKILHVLNRLGYGARPGDVERVKRMGLSAYIEEQIHPEGIDDNAIDQKLISFETLKKPIPDLVADYQEEQRLNREFNKIRTANLQPVAQTAPVAARVGDTTMMDANGTKTMDANIAAPKAARPQIDMSNMSDDQRAQLEKIIKERAVSRNSIATGAAQLTVAKIVRAVESEKQLNEVLVDFWSNHFNIDIRKNQCRVYKIADDREVIRQFAWGRFRDLLGASAKSPAMLTYLDNAQSSVPRPVNPRLAQRLENSANPGAKTLLMRAQGGINENYAREIMELHTLGVDGGYTQKDVQEVARCLTGWTIRRGDGGFNFDPRRHDDGEKIVLGHRIPANGGIEDGEKVLDLLASNPATMHHVSTQLCQKLVADEPPASLVDKCVATWKRTDGNIREIVRTIVTSPEFYSRAAYRQKIKSPFEYVVSSVRAIGGKIDVDPSNIRVAYPGTNVQTALNSPLNQALAGQIGLMGEPLFQCQPPTGYPLDSRKWVSTGALIARLNFALKLTNAQMPAVNLDDAHKIVPDGTPLPQSVNYLGDTLLGGELTPSTRATLLKEIKQSDGKEVIGTRRVAALILGSPEFQRH